jgi:acyl dehydratase
MHLDDFTIGQRFTTATCEITPDNLRVYASQFDPQPIHLDPRMAEAGMFGRIIASGWQVLSMSMKLMVESKPLGATPLVGVEVDGIRFRKPVVPGDVLTVEAVIVECRASDSKPDRGYLRLDLETKRADGDVVLTQSWTLLVPRRP